MARTSTLQNWHPLSNRRRRSAIRFPRSSKAPQRNASASTHSSRTQSVIADLRGQIDLQGQRVQLAEGLVAAAKDLLAKGYMSAVESKRREDLLLEQKQNIAN